MKLDIFDRTKNRNGDVICSQETPITAIDMAQIMSFFGGKDVCRVIIVFEYRLKLKLQLN